MESRVKWTFIVLERERASENKRKGEKTTVTLWDSGTEDGKEVEERLNQHIPALFVYLDPSYTCSHLSGELMQT